MAYKLFFELFPLILRHLKVLTEVRDVVDEDVGLSERSGDDPRSIPRLQQHIPSQCSIGGQHGVPQDPEAKRVDQARGDVVLEAGLCGRDESGEGSEVRGDEFH